MPTPTAAPETIEETVEQTGTDVADEVDADRLWVTIVWNDPVNLMSYVTYVFQKLFGYNRAKADKLMRDVHNKGRATVTSGTRDDMERDAARLHAYGLWATIAQG